MKLLIFSPYYPPHTGGLESHADQFSRHLSPFVEKITVFTPRLPQTGQEHEILCRNIEIIRFPAFEIIPNYPVPKFWSIIFWKLFFGLFKEDFDIVISRTRFFLTSLLALVYTKTKKSKWIHIEHGSDFVQLSSSFKTSIAKIYDYTFGFVIFRFSDLNISISKAVQKFTYKFDKRNSPVIYRGIEVEEIDKIQPDTKTKEEFNGKIIISFVGRLYKWKGVKKSIEAIKLLPSGLKEKIVFLIVGDGEDFRHLHNLSKNDPSIKMFGNLPHEKAVGILKISDIYIHSAHPGGGLSTSLLEAMQCGCAIIATPNEGADEVLTDGLNALLLKKNPTDEEISKKIILLSEDKNFREMISKNAQQGVKHDLNWDVVIQSYMQIFKK